MDGKSINSRHNQTERDMVTERESHDDWLCKKEQNVALEPANNINTVDQFVGIGLALLDILPAGTIS